MTIDNLLATEATATPIFLAVYAMRLKRRMKVKPINIAHANHGTWKAEIEVNGNDRLITEPVTTQAQ